MQFSGGSVFEVAGHGCTPEGMGGRKRGERVRQMDGFSVRGMEKGRGFVGCREEGK